MKRHILALVAAIVIGSAADPVLAQSSRKAGNNSSGRNVSRNLGSGRSSGAGGSRQSVSTPRGITGQAFNRSPTSQPMSSANLSRSPRSLSSGGNGFAGTARPQTTRTINRPLPQPKPVGTNLNLTPARVSATNSNLRPPASARSFDVGTPRAIKSQPSPTEKAKLALPARSSQTTIRPSAPSPKLSIPNPRLVGRPVPSENAPIKVPRPKDLGTSIGVVSPTRPGTEGPRNQILPVLPQRPERTAGLKLPGRDSAQDAPKSERPTLDTPGSGAITAAPKPERGPQIAGPDLPGTSLDQRIPGGRIPGGRGEREPSEPIPGQWQEGDVVAGNDVIVDQEFLDYMNDWYEQGGHSGDAGDPLLTGQPAPWDNPDDPFWQQDRPADWKGHWPGNPQPNPTGPGGNPTGPGKDPNEPGNPPKDPKDPGTDPTEPGTDPLDPGFDPDPDDDPPHCPPPGHETPPYEPPICVPPIGHPPICVPPIVTLPPSCPPCVATVCQPGCPPTIVATEIYATDSVITDAQEAVVAGEDLAEVPEQPLTAPTITLIVGQLASIPAEGLGSEAGQVVLEVNGIGLPATVRTWQDNLLEFDVPTIGLTQDVPAKLYLFDANVNVLVAIDVLLIQEATAGDN